jgi:hypothetical protein
MKPIPILFLPAAPTATDPLALEREVRSIENELRRSSQRDAFELVTRWAESPLDVVRELRKLKPVAVHFSGHGGKRVSHESWSSDPRRDVDSFDLFNGGVEIERLAEMFHAVGSTVRLIVLDGCYSEQQAETLDEIVDCVVGMRGTVRDDPARSFAIAFYGALGEGESVGAAFSQGHAAIALDGLRGEDRPLLRTRLGVDANGIVLAAKSRWR